MSAGFYSANSHKPMKRKKRKNFDKTIFFKTLMLIAVWLVVICMFAVAAFSYGMRQALSVCAEKVQNSEKIAYNKEYLASLQRTRQSIYLSKLFDRVEAYIRNNFVSIVEANNAGDSQAVAEDVCFINDNRALVFYKSDDNDKYLAEVVFKEDSGQVKIDRFIVKVKNDIDYSGGVYGAD